MTASIDSGAGLPPPRLNAFKRVSFALLLLIFLATWIHPLWPAEQALQSSLTIAAFVWLALHARRWRMRDGEFLAICTFIAAHCIAARWLYSNVPYDEWLRNWLRWSPQQSFGWTRNNFDRLVHLLYGLCLLPAIHTALRQRWPLGKGQSFTIGVMLIMCTSLIYEWGEWVVALSLSPKDAEAYNGQQGDMWDAHKDMLMATIGALLAWPCLPRTHVATLGEGAA